MARRTARTMLFALRGGIALLSSASRSAARPTASMPPTRSTVLAITQPSTAGQLLPRIPYRPFSAADMKPMALVRESSLREITTSPRAEQCRCAPDQKPGDTTGADQGEVWFATEPDGKNVAPTS
jgi:hypothetical protein